MRHAHFMVLAAAVFIASLTAPDAQAQGFTFGTPGPGDGVRADRPDRGARRAQTQVRRCRAERHQVYDAQGQLVWRTIQVCG